MTQSFIKWAGGKSKLAPEIRKLMPAVMKSRYYMEPFAGSAAMFFWLEENGEKPRRVTLNDQLIPLVAALNAVQNSPDALIHELLKMQDAYYTKADAILYRKWRSEINSGPGIDLFDSGRLFIALNKTCFNGLWRVNQKGQMNVPQGRSASKPNICDAKRIRECSAALKDVKLWNQNVFDLNLPDERGAVVYFDPPYAPLTKTANFSGYSGSFGEDEQIRLRNKFAHWDVAGNVCIMSNSDTPLVRELYKGYEIVEIQVKRSISCKGDKRKPVGELLIRGNTKE